MTITQHRITKPTTVEPEVLNAATDIITAARNVLAGRSANRKGKQFTNRIRSRLLDDLDEAMRKWDALP